jgi:hypothetical protein
MWKNDAEYFQHGAMLWLDYCGTAEEQNRMCMQPQKLYLALF